MGLVSRVLRSLKKAESEVARLEAAVTRWQREADEKRAQLAELRASVGARVFADDTGMVSRALAQDALDLQFQVEGAEAATKVAEEQLEEARDDLTLAQAAEKREQAAKLTAVADAHQGKVDELLRQLTELDGVDYVPFEPSPEAISAAVAQNGSFEYALPKSSALRRPAEDLTAAAAALEAPVLDKRRAHAAASRPRVPSAGIDVPAWDDIHGESRVYCAVDEGGGTATFEVHVSGQQGGAWTVTLPDEQGRRAWSRQVRIAPGSGASVRCDGEVLAKETRAGQLVSNGLGSFWVELP